MLPAFSVVEVISAGIAKVKAGGMTTMMATTVLHPSSARPTGADARELVDRV